VRAQRWVVKLDFVGANPDVRPTGEEKTDAIVSYFKGSPDEWHTGIPTYARILYRDLWPGIDLLFYGTVNELKYEFIVHPGADPGQIRLAYRGAENVTLNAAGQLEVTTPLGGFTDDVPIAYQDIDGRRVEVAVSHDMESPMHYPPISNLHSPFSFQIGSYDPTRPLVIDPAVLIYCGYIGGSYWDEGHGIAVDGAGAAYVVGYTSSSEAEGFPVVVGPDLTFNGGYDAFVAKVKASGTGLDYCGYIGGSDEDYGEGIAVDGAGAAYVVGSTDSSEAEGFPVVVGPDLTFNGNWDAFVARVKADGTGLDYCGYIGGSYRDRGYGIAVDGAGAAYVVGYTCSSEAEGFPVVVGPDLTFNGCSDAFVAKVKAGGTGLSYCGYIGGSDYDFGYGIAVDGAGAAYVVGETDSSEAEGFPVVVGPDLTYNDIYYYDAFVARVKAGGTGLDYCGYIGGSYWDLGYGIAVDGAGAAYVVGETCSSEAQGFPVVVGPDLTFNGGYNDAFVAKVKADGAGLDYCGYIGGSDWDEGHGIAVDGAGAAYVVGYTGSSEAQGFPVVVGPDLTFNGYRDAFVARVKADGTGLSYCGYIGGSSGDYGEGIAVDGAGAAYIVGYTESSEAEGFPVVVGPDLTFNGYSDAFVAKVSVTYYISGRVSDAGGRPVSDVTVSAGATYSATTGADGTYTITDLDADTYTLTPAKSGYVFSPPMRTVSVPPSVTGQNFAMLPPPVSTVLTPGTGTSLTYTDTQGLPTSLDFPAEAVTQTTTIVLTPTLAQGGAGFAFTGHAFDLAAFQGGSQQPGFTFGAPVTVTIHYSDDDVRVVTDESQLVLQWWTGSEWRDAVETCEPASSYSRDIANNVLSLPICRMSRFGLFGPTHQTYLPLILRNR
jgi:hypothetical protein